MAAATVVMAVVLATAAPAALSPCGEADGPENALCGTVAVPEDSADPDGRTLRIRVMVLPATGADPAPDPVYVLAGGPGLAATRLAAGEALRLARLRTRRAIVLVDQRGTGGSNALDCRPFARDSVRAVLGAPPSVRSIRGCRRRLERRADLARYTTPYFADDLAAVADALGHERINLFGNSYGARAGLVFMRRHPERVRSAVLMGVNGPDFDPASMALSGQRALDRLIRDCSADPACAKAFPDLRAELQRLLRRLAAERRRVTFRHPVTGEPVRTRLTRETFAEALHLMLLTSDTARWVPSLVHACAGGDCSRFAAVAAQLGLALADEIEAGLHFSVLCAEGFAGATREGLVEATRGTFLGHERLQLFLDYCREWPRGALPDGYAEPVASEAPVLLVSFELDPVTPPALAEDVARHLPNARHVVVSGATHSDDTACVRGLVATFLERGGGAGLDASCAARGRRPPFAVP